MTLGSLILEVALNIDDITEEGITILNEYDYAEIEYLVDVLSANHLTSRDIAIVLLAIKRYFSHSNIEANNQDAEKYNPYRYDDDGYKENGYDREGYDRYGYDREGYDRGGL